MLLEKAYMTYTRIVTSASCVSMYTQNKVAIAKHCKCIENYKKVRNEAKLLSIKFVIPLNGL